MTVLVIGAGLAGCVAALELARASADVVLLEAGERPMDGASRHNEGKIHLGYVYAKDARGRTVGLLQQGAGGFATTLGRHLCDGLRSVAISGPFDYLVHPQSQLSSAALDGCYQTIDAHMASLGLNQGTTDYLGLQRVRSARWHEPETLSALGLSPQAGAAAYATEERALEPFGLADAVTRALQSSTVDLRCGVVVQRIAHVGGAYRVWTSQGFMGPFESVINASWGSRQALDTSIGLHHPQAWNYRYKYFLRLRKPGLGRWLPCITWAVGAFGDIVTYGDDLAYLSWYPAGRVQWRTGDVPDALPSSAPVEIAMQLKKGILAGLTELLPALGEIDPVRDDISVFGGLILGNGTTDIDDPDSGLHRRDNIGVVSVGGYHSISTGKLTTAPLMGERAAAAVLAGSPA